MLVSAVVALACFGVAIGSPTELHSGANLNPVEVAESSDKVELREKRTPGRSWVQVLTAYDEDYDDEDNKPRRKSGNAADRPLYLPLELPIGGSRSRGHILPLLVLPFSAGAPRISHRKEYDDHSDQDTIYHDNENYYEESPIQRPRRPTSRPPAKRPVDTERQPQKPANTCKGSDDATSPPPIKPSKPRSKKPQYPSYIRVDQLDQTAANPSFEKAASSKELVERFRAQAPEAPGSPPAVFSEYDGTERVLETENSDEVPTLGASPIVTNNSPPSRNSFQTQQNYYTTSFGTGVRSRDPSRPLFNRSLVLHGQLTVPRADFTETYTAWFDAKSGSARVSFYGGSTSTYRAIMPDGSVQRLEMRMDRSGEGQIRRCGKAESPQSTRADRAPPALPDLELFTFAGYEQSDGGRAERWRLTERTGAGERGGAQGESLTLRHELVLLRAQDDSARPLRYTVNIDSSVLGTDCDGYQHQYLDAREFNPDSTFFTPNIVDTCDFVQTLNASSAEHLARLEPLLEFTLPHRDLRYDEAFQRFKTEYNRQYADNTEEAVRKNLLMQHLRFIRSGNREGATFELAPNYLADRLDDELAELRGLQLSPENTRAEIFPHTRDSLKKEEPSLPDRFDWRPRGGVSPVRYQGSCSSCWAFAVAGAVEGALFLRTHRLVPLSEKCLVDCAHPFGGNGCKGTWPSHAYDYVQNRGLPALEEYPEYKDKVDTCQEKSVRSVTRISGHVNVTANSVTALKVAIRQHAPSVVIIDAKAKSFIFYKKGVLYDDRCAKTPKKLNHAVLAVGWGQRKGEPHFILKNSWSEAWGERGYVRVQARANTCGVLARPSYPRIQDGDILRDLQGSIRVQPR
ncbi:uncharacterized protein LOC126777034 [Nymphalis io]|uniref:uncharacterized protein LOC126777034 n=1 Tax=Inachis io TaxID=171585 RepID=UPI0021672FB6|nr:uncharacterized protein LOC126777034 [Nymphalis io]